jgi:hypothetical protein
MLRFHVEKQLEQDAAGYIEFSLSPGENVPVSRIQAETQPLRHPPDCRFGQCEVLLTYTHNSIIMC